MTKPDPGAQIQPLTREVHIDAGEIAGPAIAFSWNGNAIQYLVVDHNAEGPPVWVDEHQVTNAYVLPLRTRDA